jgi:hypothetical protein
VLHVFYSEKAIIAYQEAEEALEIENEKNDVWAKAKPEEDQPQVKPDIIVPPIPEPPTPPRQSLFRITRVRDEIQREMIGKEGGDGFRRRFTKGRFRSGRLWGRVC